MIRITQTKTLDAEARALLRTSLSDDLTLGEILEQTEDNQGTLYLIHTDRLVGVAYFQVFGDILNLRSLAAEKNNIKEWAAEFQDFVVSLMREHNIPRFIIYSRMGWHKLFPKLSYEGSVYTFNL